MIIIFAGTPVFAAIALKELLRSSHKIVAIYTQPDRPAGRGLQLTSSPVKQLAAQQHLPVYQPTTLKTASEQALLASFKADVMVVAAYGMLLPDSVLTIPQYGCINIHPSLLPRWRGAAPIQRTIFSGDKVSGVTIMQMDAHLDTGPILLQHPYYLSPDETTKTLHDKLAKMGAIALIDTLDLLTTGQMQPTPQDNSLATYANKISKQEGLLDWTQPAIKLEYIIRAFNPWPVAYTVWRGKNLRIWQAKALEVSHHANPSTILAATPEGIDIATGKGILRLLQVQLPGGKILSVANFYCARYHDLVVGQSLI